MHPAEIVLWMLDNHPLVTTKFYNVLSYDIQYIRCIKYIRTYCIFNLW